MARRSLLSRVLRELPIYLFGALLILLAAVLILLLSPLILLLFIQALLFPPKQLQFPAAEAAEVIRQFLDGEGGAWDWDDFTSASADHPALEEIRRRAASVDLPLTPEGEKQLGDLLVEAQQLAEREHAASSSLTKLLCEAVAGREVTAAQLDDGVAYEDLTCKPGQKVWQTLTDWIEQAEDRKRRPGFAHRWRKRLAKKLAEIGPHGGGK